MNLSVCKGKVDVYDEDRRGVIGVEARGDCLK